MGKLQREHPQDPPKHRSRQEAPECLEYVLVHEMIHLLEPTHNVRFVSLMDRFMPNWQLRRDQLNQLPLRHKSGDIKTGFARYIGINCSDVERFTASPKGRCVYPAKGDAPLAGNWSSRGTAQPKNPNDITAEVRRRIPSPVRAKFEKYGFRRPDKRVKSTR